MSSVETTRGTWGPLSEPIHGPVPEGRPPYKDNSYLAFWDADRDVYGVFHFSTSPNAEGRRSRFTLQAAGETVEIIETPAPGTFDTESISFDLDQTYSVDGDGVTGTLRATPTLALADYNKSGILPELVPGEPLEHWQRAAIVEGSFTIGGETVEFTGHGLRDRTWGYRDESVGWSEYIGMMAVYEDRVIACMTFARPDGQSFTDGFILGEDDQTPITKMSVTRDASGLYAGSTFTLSDGTEITQRTTRRPAGFWVPMGWERTGPTMAAYDEFIGLQTGEGADGFALVEQGQIRNIY
jgi:hypothetical protein